MTLLSVNLNKIALLRNSRGRDFPNVCDFARKNIDLGVRGITVHPRQDERHITNQDAYDLGAMLAPMKGIEYNIEGYPSDHFLRMVEDIKPDQCTLVPDSPDQLTSDHGWDMKTQFDEVDAICQRLNALGVRSAIFLDPDVEQVQLAAQSAAQRIELYTEQYAAKWGTPMQGAVLEQYRAAATKAQELSLGVNAGHDLDSQNLADFLCIPNVLEVSIGHVLTVECIERGMVSVISDYLAICAAGSQQ
ncbi:MAG: pyridoxine 5'-phosphate synthase [Gammaproteobacteria bacterium]|jgi:pyridoxine 5-phosphate synthase|nr:pyridoxine 5'-phosphate synthase [Gammaproteobacteria bacterium]MCP4881033.1 pyridoxine 5'-phosphate synthase [Gammaproteobacteria bacterium]MDP6165258.1 pyridoxine 5'-phosphate synthase [Gammaproteobacteria bacterium]